MVAIYSYYRIPVIIFKQLYSYYVALVQQLYSYSITTTVSSIDFIKVVLDLQLRSTSIFHFRILVVKYTCILVLFLQYRYTDTSWYLSISPLVQLQYRSTSRYLSTKFTRIVVIPQYRYALVQYCKISTSDYSSTSFRRSVLIQQYKSTR